MNNTFVKFIGPFLHIDVYLFYAIAFADILNRGAVRVKEGERHVKGAWRCLTGDEYKPDLQSLCQYSAYFSFF